MINNVSQKLSLLTLNTFGTPFFAPDITKRYKQTAQLINSSNYDIVCLQEIFTYYHLYIFKKTLTNFPYVIYQKNPFGPKGGLVIFSKLHYVNQTFVTYSFPKNAYVPYYAKIMQHGMLSAYLPFLKLRICTTHLSSDSVHNLSPKNKLYSLIQGQLQDATNAVNHYTKMEENIILTGDFNIAKDSDLYKEFINKTSMTDVFQEEKMATYYPDRLAYLKKSSAGRIDFVFIKSMDKTINISNKNHIFKDKEILSTGEKSYLSDHIGLHCILEVNE